MAVLTLNMDELRTLHTVLGVALEKATDDNTLNAITTVLKHMADDIKKYEAQENYDYKSQDTDFNLTCMDLLHITMIYNYILDTIALPLTYFTFMTNTLGKIKDIAREEIAQPLN